MTARRENPGRSQSTKRPRYAAGGMKVPADRVAWVNLFAGSVSVDQYDEAVPEDGEPGDAEPGYGVSLRLQSRFEGDKITKWILTHFTEPELDAFESVLVRAIELARPTVRMRDQNAREALERGDSNFARSYRDVPRVVERPRPSRKHDPGISG